ncbi:MAG: UDP-N-acetylmuramate--L-alanine ligase [Bacillota bacterium]|nr:UDP-N-acetylmuramate--L-alanine ligase [Bacillota bacterium]
MIGIGGSGMSPIAKVLLEMGHRVSGSDLKGSSTTLNLEAMGARISLGHRPENVEGADLVVVSTAIAEGNPELVAARERGLPVVHRSDMLAALMNERYGIAVAGAHGKTTVTSMIALVLERAGLDPTVVIGGELNDIGGSAKYGRGSYLVAEADESDRSFLRYRPRIAVVTTIEADHLEYYDGTLAKLVATFEEFLRNLPPDGLAVLGVDDQRVSGLRERLPRRTATYALQAEADYTADHLSLADRGSTFEVYHRRTCLGSLSLVVPGRHNVANALATLAVAAEVGIPFEAVREHLASFHGAKRRFQFIGEEGGVTVVDDYAHHPTEIKATLRAAREGWPGRRIVAVFQPHRYTRTHFLMEEFSKAFGYADAVVLAGIYSPPPEKPIPGVTAERLARLIEANEGRPVALIEDNRDIINYLARTVQAGDMVITMGAGDIWMVAEELVSRLRQERVPASR